MKIMQVIPEFCLGGAETMCANLSIELKNQGHEIIVVSLYRYRSSITERLEKNGIKVIYLDKKPGVNLGLILKLKKLIKNEKPDVVHTHLYAAKYVHFVAAFLGVKGRIHTIHNLADKDGSIVEQKVNKLLIHHFRVVPVSLSDLVAKTVEGVYEVDYTPIVLNGVPLNNCLVKKNYSIVPIKYVHIGRFSEQKNHAGLIKAFVNAHSMYNNIELFMYGEGELENEMKELVFEMKADTYIHFCGVTSNPYRVMEDADCFILPSLWEGVPMTLIEAMGTGLPIIASDVGGVSNMLINDKSAILIKPEEKFIVDAICKLQDNGKLCEILGKNALKESVRFSASTMAHKYEKVYEEALKI